MKKGDKNTHISSDEKTTKMIKLIKEQKNIFRFSLKIEEEEDGEFLIRPFVGYFLVQKEMKPDLINDYN